MVAPSSRIESIAEALKLLVNEGLGLSRSSLSSPRHMLDHLRGSPGGMKNISTGLFWVVSAVASEYCSRGCVHHSSLTLHLHNHGPVRRLSCDPPGLAEGGTVMSTSTGIGLSQHFYFFRVGGMLHPYMRQDPRAMHAM